MKAVRAKKQLGQHFLKEESIAKRIVDLLQPEGKYQKVLEVGPGMGVLTQFLLTRTDIETHGVEIDPESVEYLSAHYPEFSGRIYQEDVLKVRLSEKFQLADNEQIAIIGNFPYNISSQIFFKVLEDKSRISEVVCMLQKEVAKRIASPPGNKDYGILSVLLQAYYDIQYHFTVPPGAFNPPPKVDSGIIRLTRNSNEKLDCDERLFFVLVKAGFNQRRKKLSNALKAVGYALKHPLLEKRAEQLGYQDFVTLAQLARNNESAAR